jgi:two-component system nitrate/nitrite sensor histidine kinase NarX
MFRQDEVELIRVPLNYQDEVLGIYDLFVVRPGVSDREDIMELLSTIGHHLGMAVAKQRSDEEARRLSIIEERTNLAHELHDSIAQTLASLRFQVRLLDDTLKRSQAPDTAISELERIRTGLDEAHTELRELLSNFRAPLDQRGLFPALEKLTRRFEQKTGVHAFFHQECRQLKLSAAQEMQILRIVQEALTNIRKHAQAHTVRVMLNCRGANKYVLLVEDDGAGFDSPDPAGRAGEQIGLAIMRERARRIGAELRIESEAGEGTRVELTFSPQPRYSAGLPETVDR